MGRYLVYPVLSMSVCTVLLEDPSEHDFCKRQNLCSYIIMYTEEHDILRISVPESNELA